MYVFLVLVKFGYLSGRLLGNSCSLQYVSKYKYLIVNLDFPPPPLGFWSGNFFLIAPFPDHCLLVCTVLYNSVLQCALFGTDVLGLHVCVSNCCLSHLLFYFRQDENRPVSPRPPASGVQRRHC